MFACVKLSDLEISNMRKPRPAFGRSSTRIQKSKEIGNGSGQPRL